MTRPRGARAGPFLMIGLLLAPSTPNRAQVPPTGRAALGAHGADARPARLLPDQAQLAAASPQLLARLRGGAFDYFRFVNRPWAERACQAFAGDLRSAPAASLHGDAHVEQYAFTSTARGLDDFDDSARGPLVVDLVRFLGSIELAARDRGWSAELDALADRFLDGYQRGLADSRYLPPDPTVVGRLRPLRARNPEVFMAAAESVMFPFTKADRAAMDASLRRLERLLRGVNPRLPARYLRVKKGGWARIGVGSALTPKVLLRVEGPGPSPRDDLIVEGKQLSDLRGVSCLEIPRTAEALRVISGTEQIGRLRHEVLAVIPGLPGPRLPGPEWWVRSWDASYAEVRVDDYNGLEEFAEVVYDAGAQLGAGAVLVTTPGAQAQARQLAQDTLARLAHKARTVAHALVEELLVEWNAFREGATPAARPGDPSMPARRVP